MPVNYCPERLNPFQTIKTIDLHPCKAAALRKHVTETSRNLFSRARVQHPWRVPAHCTKNYLCDWSKVLSRARQRPSLTRLWQPLTRIKGYLWPHLYMVSQVIKAVFNTTFTPAFDARQKGYLMRLCLISKVCQRYNQIYLWFASKVCQRCDQICLWFRSKVWQR